MVTFAKGHGTQNDFIIIPDRCADIEFDMQLVAALCDRHRGLGADGLLHVSKASALVEKGVLEALPADVSGDDWFMDYRNADGTIAEMCGNGVRVFAHYVAAHLDPGAVDGGHLRVGTRAGLRPVRLSEVSPTTATVSVSMGSPELIGVATAEIVGANATQRFAGLGIDVGNPHLACIVPSLVAESLAELDLSGEVHVPQEMFPEGVNVELATELDIESGVHMRVIERGCGETRSCGTGTVAVAVSALSDAEKTEGTVYVTVPGGRVRVDIEAIDNGGNTASHSSWQATLTGPSVIHSTGQIDLSVL